MSYCFRSTLPIFKTHKPERYTKKTNMLYQWVHFHFYYQASLRSASCSHIPSTNLSAGELDVGLGTRLDVRVVPPDAYDKRDHHRQEVVDVDGPFVRK
jgi:hypothetical protein